MPYGELSKPQRTAHRNLDFRDLKLEYRFVGGILKNQDALAKVVAEFKSDSLTSDRLQTIYECAVKLFTETGEGLTYKSLDHMLDVSDVQRKRFKRTYKKCKVRGKTLTYGEIVTAATKLMKFYQAREVELSIKEQLGYLGKALEGDLGQIDKTIKSIETTAQRVAHRKVSSTVTDPTEEYDEWRRRYIHIQKHPEQIDAIYTGIRPIDRCMHGIRSGEFALLISQSGMGKSIGLQNIATHCWKMEGDVAWVTIEMPKEQCYNRWYCELSGLDYNKFRNYTLSKQELKKLDKTIERAKANENKLHIIDMPESCTAQAIGAELEILMKKRDIKLLCVDYLNIMGNTESDFSMEWRGQVTTAVEVKRLLARKYNIPTWSVVQANEGEKIAFAKNIKDNIDVGVMFFPTDDYEETHMLRMSWIKTRDFEGEGAIISTDRGHMKLWLDVSAKENKRKRKMKKLSRKKKGSVTV